MTVWIMREIILPTLVDGGQIDIAPWERTGESIGFGSYIQKDEQKDIVRARQSSRAEA